MHRPIDKDMVRAARMKRVGLVIIVAIDDTRAGPNPRACFGSIESVAIFVMPPSAVGECDSILAFASDVKRGTPG